MMDGMRDYRVSDLMSGDVITLREEQSLPLARDLMKLRKIRHLPVVDDEGALVGLITQRDLLAAQVSYQSFSDEGDRGAIDLDIPVKNLMKRDVWTVAPTAGAFEAGQLLVDHSFSCLPVIDEHRRVVGILTDRDFLKYALEVLERFENPGDHGGGM